MPEFKAAKRLPGEAIQSDYLRYARNRRSAIKPGVVAECAGAFSSRACVSRKLEGAGQDLRRKIHRDHLQAVVGLDRFSRWARSLLERRGYWKAAVAIAAKNARLVWTVLHYGETFRLIDTEAATPAA